MADTGFAQRKRVEAQFDGFRPPVRASDRTTPNAPRKPVAQLADIVRMPSAGEHGTIDRSKVQSNNRITLPNGREALDWQQG